MVWYGNPWYWPRNFLQDAHFRHPSPMPYTPIGTPPPIKRHGQHASWGGETTSWGVVGRGAERVRVRCPRVLTHFQIEGSLNNSGNLPPAGIDGSEANNVTHRSVASYNSTIFLKNSSRSRALATLFTPTRADRHGPPIGFLS